MKLAIFDIDGTLTRTTGVDARCALRAFEEEFGIAGIETDWSSYRHPSDSGITHEVLARHFRRPARADEIKRLERRFLRLLRAAVRDEASAVVEVPGAAKALAALGGDRDWAVAVATGGWRATSLCKLEAAGIDIAALPAAFSDDDPSREEILKLAVRLARERHGGRGFEKVVSIGDAVWDVRAARNLGLAFLGVAADEAAEALRRAGARSVIPDYVDLDAFRFRLDEAELPAPES